MGRDKFELGDGQKEVLLKRLGKRKWRRHVSDVVRQLKIALQADYVVLGGGNAKLLKQLPHGARLGDNSNAFRGGFRLWAKPPARPTHDRIAGAIL